mmetsp:Transcript_23427/g.67265  ORF Transcript_23427/g.67265 Transcript_23427/m.67265 type:complete len:268 (+) Transcript_23427:3369-4172(+)
MSSKLTTEVAPCLMEVPMQSLPVSPPPMTMTLLPLALMCVPSLDFFSHSGPTSPWSTNALVFWCRNSIAKCTPLRSRPGILRSRAVVEPVASTSASYSSSSCLGVGATMDASPASHGLPPMLPAGPQMYRTPSFSISSTRRITTSILSAFMLGTPYIIRPPGRSARSKTVTEWPILLSWSAAAMPAGPEPTMAMFLPVRWAGGLGTIQPISNPLSMVAHSMFLMVTGFSMMPSTQAPSQGAGQTRPVNSGKLLVSSSRSRASFQFSS